MSHAKRTLFIDGEYKLEINDVNLLTATIGDRSKSMILTRYNDPITLFTPYAKSFEKAGKDPSQIRYLRGSDKFFIRVQAAPAIELEIDRIKKDDDAAKEAREVKLAEAIPGLRQLQAAIESEAQYFESFNKMMEDENNDGVNAPSAPAESSDALRAKYPKAAAYAKAQGYSYASHFEKAGAGKKAMRLLEAGGTVEEANEVLENWLPESAKWN